MTRTYIKGKNLIALCFTAFYILMLALDIEIIRFPFLTNFRYAFNSLIIYLVPMIAPVLVFIFLLFEGKNYNFRRFLLPIAFGFNLLKACFSFFQSLSILKLCSAPQMAQIVLISTISLLSVLAVFIGSLANFKYILLFKIGVLVVAVHTITISIIEFIQLGGMAYIQSVPEGYPAINVTVLITEIALVLFYIGLFIGNFKITNKSEITE